MTYATRNIASADAYKKTMMKRLVTWHAVALAALTAFPAFAQNTPNTPPTPPPAPTSPANEAEVKRPSRARPGVATPPIAPVAPIAPPAPPDPSESPRDAARRARREARDAQREAERMAREAERRAEEAERAMEEAEEAADEAEENADEDDDDDGPNLRIEGDDRDVVMTGQDVRIDPGQRVRSAVAIGGSVILSPGSHVEDDAVAVGGDVVLEPGARVEGDAVSIGGSIKTEPGATIGGSKVNLAPSAHFIGSVFKQSNPGAAAWSFFSTIISIIRILVLFALATLLVVLAPERVGVMRGFIAERPFVSAMAGIAAQVAIVPLCILLVVTLIGIPLAPVAVVTFLCILVVGFTVVAVWIGERLPLFKDKKTMFASLALGFVVLTLIDLLIPIVGTIMVFTASLIGAGAVLLSRFGQVRAATLPPPPSPPSPGTYMTRT